MSDGKIETVDINGQSLRIDSNGIVLVEQEFKPGNIDAVRASLGAAFKLIEEWNYPGRGTA